MNAEQFNPGSVRDPRPIEAQARNFSHAEIYGIAAIPWGVKDPSMWSKYSIRNQNGSSTCIGQGIAKAFEVRYGEPYSALPIYTNRKNTGPGMWLQDGGDIAIKIGTVPERLCPSQNMTEAQCNVPVDMSKFAPSDIKKARAYVFCNAKDIDQIAQALDAGHPVILTFESNYDEWKEIPKYSGGPIQWGHCVCDPKDRTLWTDDVYKNMKAIVIDESWGVGINADGILPVDGKRLITEDFIKARCTGAMYLIFDEDITPSKPKHTFYIPMEYGMMNNKEVKALQDCLAYEGLFSNDPQFHKGNYLQMTAKAVWDFQKKYNIAPSAELDTLQGKNVGPKTRAYLNKIYG